METPATVWRRRAGIAAIIVLSLVVAFYAARRVITGVDRFAIEQTRPVASRVDGMLYRVHEGHPGPGRAADALATINQNSIGVMRYLRDRYVRGADGEAFPARRQATERLLARYNPDNLAENSPRDPSGDTSYVMDKGAIIALCLRPRGPGAPIHDMSMLMFVALHEMAHVAIDQVEHPEVFWRTFRFLLESAEEAGVYASPDFTAHPRSYCGIPVDYNPRFDPGVVAVV